MKKLALKLPGRVYQKYNMRDGVKVYQTTWTVRYKGKDHATGETDADKATQYLMKLAGGAMDGAAAKPKPWAVALATAVRPTAATVTVIAEVLQVYIDHCKLRGLAVAKIYEGSVNNYLRPFFGTVPANDLTTSMFTAYKKDRMKTVKDMPRAAELSRGATVNREMALLKSALIYGRDTHEPPLLNRFPHIEMLPESKPRKGFLAHRDYLRLRHALPAYWEPVFVTAYHVGRRRGELLQLEIDDVIMDGDSPEVRVPADITKNGTPSQFPIYGDMTEVLRKQIAMTRRDYPNCKLLFHKNGKHIQKNETFYKEWDRACEIAGIPGLLGHDLRRTACKMLIAAGNSRKAAMEVTGHLTESAFNRYHITDSNSMQDTVVKATAFLAKQRAALLEESASGLIS